VSARGFALPLGAARPREGRIVAGVCAGLAARGRTDPTLVRLAFALLSFAAGAGLIAYLALWAMLPEEGARCRASRKRRVAAVVLLLVAAQVALHGLGLGNSLVWPLLLASLGYVVWTYGDELGLRSRSRRVVADDICTRPEATARRRDNGFDPTSTIRTAPLSSTSFFG